MRGPILEGLESSFWENLGQLGEEGRVSRDPGMRV